jgi:hypothetical protein
MAVFKPKKLIRGAHRTIIRAALTKMIQVDNWDQRIQAHNPGVDMSSYQFAAYEDDPYYAALQAVIDRLQQMLQAKTAPPPALIPVPTAQRKTA